MGRSVLGKNQNVATQNVIHINALLRQNIDEGQIADEDDLEMAAYAHEGQLKAMSSRKRNGNEVYSADTTGSKRVAVLAESRPAKEEAAEDLKSSDEGVHAVARKEPWESRMEAAEKALEVVRAEVGGVKQEVAVVKQEIGGLREGMQGM